MGSPAEHARVERRLALRRLGAALVVVACGGAVAAMERLTGFRSPVFAVELHFLLMTGAVFVDKLLDPAVDGPRFDVSARELRVHRRLGVMHFMRALQRIGWTRAMRDDAVFDGTRRTIASYELATRRGENAHTWLFAIVLAPIAWAIARGWWDAVLWIGATNVLFHLYPVMLQRTQRARLRALLERRPPTSADEPVDVTAPTGRATRSTG